MSSISVNSQHRYSPETGDFSTSAQASASAPAWVERPAGFPPGAPNTAVTRQQPNIPPSLRNTPATGPQFSSLPPGVHVERPSAIPPGAPDTIATLLRSEEDLLQYRVSPSNLRGLQPDRNGIYARTNADRSKTYFANVDGDTYRIGGFDRQNLTWRVLDPRSGKEVVQLERKGGKWVAALPKQYESTHRGRILRALDAGIQNVRQALSQIHGSWSRATTTAMNKLFGRGVASEASKTRIERGLRQTLNEMEASRRTGARNLRVDGPGGPWQPSAFAYPDGTVYFTQFTLNNWRPADLNELMVHESTHTGARTTDNWYLNRNNDRLPNWGGGIAPLTFQNAVNNADTMARASSVLANN
jgi:hypothetical protein